MIEVDITETVQFYDTDCGGVVSNIAYLRHVERARTSLFATLGMEPAGMMESGLFPVVIRTEINYRSPARLGDEIRVTARLTAVENVRATCHFRLIASAPGGESRTVAEAQQVVALVQMPAGRPTRMPSEWLRLIE